MCLAETHLGREGAVCPEPILDARNVLGEYRPGASLPVWVAGRILGRNVQRSKYCFCPSVFCN